MKHFWCAYDFEDSGDAENGPGQLEPQSGFLFDAEDNISAEKFIREIYFKNTNMMFQVNEVSEEEFQRIKNEEEEYAKYVSTLDWGEMNETNVANDK